MNADDLELPDEGYLLRESLRADEVASIRGRLPGRRRRTWVYSMAACLAAVLIGIGWWATRPSPGDGSTRVELHIERVDESGRRPIVLSIERLPDENRNGVRR
ncbi:MAG TPA: hypothetical protein VF139_13965 [Candidatus Polarisedimenticolaceae bacterium]